MLLFKLPSLNVLLFKITDLFVTKIQFQSSKTLKFFNLHLRKLSCRKRLCKKTSQPKIAFIYSYTQKPVWKFRIFIFNPPPVVMTKTVKPSRTWCQHSWGVHGSPHQDRNFWTITYVIFCLSEEANSIFSLKTVIFSDLEGQIFLW